MKNSQDATVDMTMMLNAVGGEPLAGSGFENEQSEDGFASEELGIDELRLRAWRKLTEATERS